MRNLRDGKHQQRQQEGRGDLEVIAPPRAGINEQRQENTRAKPQVALRPRGGHQEHRTQQRAEAWPAGPAHEDRSGQRQTHGPEHKPGFRKQGVLPEDHRGLNGGEERQRHDQQAPEDAPKTAQAADHHYHQQTTQMLGERNQDQRRNLGDEKCQRVEHRRQERGLAVDGPMMMGLEKVDGGHEVMRVRVVVAPGHGHHQTSAQQGRDDHARHAEPEEFMQARIEERGT